MEDSFTRQITIAEEQLNALWHYTDRIPDQGEPIRPAIETLAAILKDLFAAHTELEQQNAALLADAGSQAANRLLQALIETMPIGLTIADKDGTLQTSNAAAQAILGEPPAGNVARPERGYTTFYPDGSPFPPEDNPLFHALREGKVVRDVAIRIRRRDGSECTISASAAPVFDERGEIYRGVSVFEDITERQQAQQILQRHAEDLERRVARRTAAMEASQARLRAIFGHAAMGIALADAQGHIVESNPALQAMLGYAADVLEAMTFLDFTHPDDRAADLKLFEELVAGARQEYDLEKRYIHKDGRIIWARLKVSLVQSRERPVYAVGLIEDVTEQRQAVEALQRAEKLAIAGQLGASLAHEISNPLQSVIGCLGLAERNLAEGGDPSRYLRLAREELRRAASIVAQLRDLHRVRERDEKEPVDLNTLIEDVLVLCRQKCEECKIDVSWHGADDLPTIPLVADRLRQVFLNLIFNALEATPAGGRLEIRITRTLDPGGVSISFTDNGRGIDPDALPHLFEPFYSTKASGLGLGLHITDSIVKAHGGHIDVMSQPGQGSTFTLWLPAQRASNPNARDERTE